MVEEIQQSLEHEEQHPCCRCISDQDLFLGKLSDGECDSNDFSEPMKDPVHLGNFVGYDPDDMSCVGHCSVRSLTTGSSENDQAIIWGMIKAARSRLRRECIDESLVSTIEGSGSVGWLRHSQIELGEKLGVGSFSNVFEVKSLTATDRDRLEKDSGNPVPERLVIKILKSNLVRRPSSLSMCAADLVKEGAILALLGRHPNLVSLVAWTPTGLGGFSDNGCGVRHDSFFLVMDRLEESLNDRLLEWRSDKSIRKKQGFFQERFQIMTDLANAVQHVHSKGVIHRDLKPNNIGFDFRGALKVFDFDVSRIIPKDLKPKQAKGSQNSEDATFRLTQHVGTQRYMSPECARGEPYNAKSDVYAFGLVCHEILTLKIPYDHFRRSEDHYRSVFVGRERPSIPWRWPKALRNFISNCWAHAIPIRPTMEKAFVFLTEEAGNIATSMEKKSKSKSVKAALDSFRGDLQPKKDKHSRKSFLRRKFSSSPNLTEDHKQHIALEEPTTAKEDSLTGSCFLR